MGRHLADLVLPERDAAARKHLNDDSADKRGNRGGSKKGCPARAPGISNTGHPSLTVRMGLWKLPRHAATERTTRSFRCRNFRLRAANHTASTLIGWPFDEGPGANQPGAGTRLCHRQPAASWFLSGRVLIRNKQPVAVPRDGLLHVVLWKRLNSWLRRPLRLCSSLSFPSS
jgi:hypothetical protein